MQADVLEADEVLAVGDAPGDGHGDAGLAVVGPRDGGARDGGPVAVDLEPDRAGRVEAGGGGGGLGHVDVDGARVVDVGRDAEGDGAAGGDGEGLRGGGAGGELVAAHGGRVDVLDGAVGVVVGRAAGELPVGAGDAVGRDAGDGVWFGQSVVCSACSWGRGGRTVGGG